MSSRERVLRQYVENILEGNDKDVWYFSMKYRNHYLPQIMALKLERESFSTNIRTIAEELFITRSTTYPYVLSLLIFSFELDGYCRRIYSSWYTTATLVDILVNILSDYNYTPPNYNYNICNIIYHACFHFICLLLIGGWECR